MPSTTVDRKRGVERHLAAAKEYIAIAESGDAERSAYEHAALEIEAAMQENPKLSQRDVAKQVGKTQKYVWELLQALKRSRTSGEPFRMEWLRGSARGRPSDLEVGARERPEAFVEAFKKAPAAARKAIAKEISKAPEVRAEARQRDVEAETTRKPNPVKQRGDHVLYDYEGKLVSARRSLRDALALVDSLDQAGDDEDILQLLTMLKELVDANDEAYRSGKSLDTWAWELYERSAD